MLGVRRYTTIIPFMQPAAMIQRRQRIVFLILMVMSLLLRFSLMFLDYSWDVNNHISWAQDLHRRGFDGFYDTPSSEVYASIYPNYPPVALFIFYFIYPLQSILFQFFWWLNITVPFFPSKLIFFVESRAFQAGWFKLPAMVGDLALAYLLYCFAKKQAPHNKKLHLFALSFVFFNPAFFYNSSYWGQIDVLPLLGIILSLYLLLFTRRFITSGIVFTLGLLVKPTILIYLPVYAVFFIRRSGVKKFLAALVFSLILFWASFFPFLKEGVDFFYPVKIFSEKIMAAQSLSFVTNGAFNFWVLITHFKGIPDVTSLLLGFSYKRWGFFITAVFYAAILYQCAKSNNPKKAFFSGLFFISFASFLFLTRMHERYSMLLLPFAFLAGLHKRQFLVWSVILSFFSFLNLYHSWPVPRIEMLTTLLSNPYVETGLSFLNVVSFVYLAKKFMVVFRGDIKNRSR